MAAVVPPVRLVYTSESAPGIHRHRDGRGFSYLLPDGSRVTDRAEIRRLAALAIPPAYEGVWICLNPNGHLQATGLDQRGRKQYRYHPAWHEKANRRKFSNLPAFVAALPRIRQRVRQALKEEGMSRDRVIAGVVSLLDLTGYRIGNKQYERFNRSFGLASLLVRHLKQEDGQWTMRFKGKSGQFHEATINDPNLATLFSGLQELPGQHLFRYEDDHGTFHDIETSDINAWLKEVGGGDFTAKQFRTWKATVLCATELGKNPPPEGIGALRRVIRQAVVATAGHLHHTPSTCRKYYLPPVIFDAFKSGALFEKMHAPAPPQKGLHADERRVLSIVMPGARKPPRAFPAA